MTDEVAGVEFAGLENNGLENEGLENDALENDALENDGVEQEQTYMLRTKTNFNGYDPLRHVIVLNTNLTTYIFQHLQLHLLKK